jgi:hypothetical protein
MRTIISYTSNDEESVKKAFKHILISYGGDSVRALAAMKDNKIAKEKLKEWNDATILEIDNIKSKIIKDKTK